MGKQKSALIALQNMLEKIELDLKRVKLLIGEIVDGKIDSNEENLEPKLQELASKLLNYKESTEVKVIEGVYDGYFMIGSDEKKYPVPMNYSSKTKLIPGDVLKLRILEDGKLIYKLIGPANRQYIKASLSKSNDNKFIAVTDEGETYYLNQAAVTFFKGKAGDELSIIINSEGDGNYAALEALIPQE